MISNPHPQKNYKHGVTAAISGRTSDMKDVLKAHGFRWNNARRNWYKFGDSHSELLAECLDIWQSEPGRILFDVFEWVRPQSEIPF